jgi:hypothetical protein
MSKQSFDMKSQNMHAKTPQSKPIEKKSQKASPVRREHFAVGQKM